MVFCAAASVLLARPGLANTAPVLTPSAPDLPGLTEEDTLDDGITVAELIGDSISDGDADAVEGIAIYEAHAGNGTWIRYIASVGGWYYFGNVTVEEAILLRPNDRIAFVPNGLNRTVATFSFCAWDQTGDTGAEFEWDTSRRGGETPFSLATDTATLVVEEVQNDPPWVGVMLDDLAIDVGDQLEYTLPDNAFRDLDGVITNITARQAGGAPLPDWLSFDPLARRLLGTPGQDDRGHLELTIVALHSLDGQIETPLAVNVLPIPVTQASVLKDVRIDPAGTGIDLDLAALFEDPTFPATVRFDTIAGHVDIRLFDSATPLTVANFLAYIDAGAYENSIVHRVVPGFVVQGGGFQYLPPNQGTPTEANYPAVNTIDPVPNEPGISNTRGTVAMAKLGGDPDSATSQWFFNLSDGNAANLDYQNGGFTVFGRVVSGMDAVDAMAGLTLYDKSDWHSAFDDLPLRDYEDDGHFADETELALVSHAFRLSGFAFEVQAANPELLQLVMEDQTLRITPVPDQIGSTEVTIRATTLDGRETVEQTFTVHVRDPEPFQWEIRPGWQTISVPFEVEGDLPLAGLLVDADGLPLVEGDAWMWNSATGLYEVLSGPAAPGQGVWVFGTPDEPTPTTVLYGIPLTQSCALSSGWTLAGPPGSAADSRAALPPQTDPPDALAALPFLWNGTAFQEADTLPYGSAAWFFCERDCTAYFTPSTAARILRSDPNEFPPQ